MQNLNAIKTLTKKGLDVRSSEYNQLYADTLTDRISWINDRGIAHSFYVKSHSAQDDIQTDHFAGVWCQTLKSAMNIAGIK